jgi:ubiquinone/menaquinone biosynthesis C-methylase UbiE
MESHQWDDYVHNYHELIVSPLKDGVQNPLFAALDKIVAPKSLSVADLGTGRGDLLPLLSERFKQVYAVDFSADMLAIAKDKHKKLSNITFIQADMRTLAEHGLLVDVAVAVNSILHTSPRQIHQTLQEIHRSVKEGGLLLAIFPAAESFVHYAMLVHERELGDNEDEEKAVGRMRKVVEHHKYDLLRGIYDDDGERQKLFYRFELQNRLRAAGFKYIKVKKVVYPWGLHGEFDAFPDKPPMWDWFVVAQK